MFAEPHWLLLVIPAVLFLFRGRMPGRKLLFLRLLVLLLVIFALAGARMRIPGRDGMIVIVADRSLSMPPDADTRIKETVDILKEQIPANARLGLISFGANARVEMAPARSSFSGFSADINAEASNLSEGIEKALALIPSESSGRIVVISDGQWTGRDPRLSAFKAAKRGIPVDFRLVTRSYAKDLAITSFRLPGLLSPGESFVISAEIYSPVEQVGQIELNCSGIPVSSFRKTLRPGRNTLIFRHSAPDSSVVKYQIRVVGDADDPVPENNIAVAIAEIEGKKPVLIISNTSSGFLTGILDKSGLKYNLFKPAEMHWNIEMLSGYSAVILDNVSANSVTAHGMAVLSAWVEHLGGGLMVTGGKNSFGTGGYYRSSLEGIMPVSLELRSEHRKLSLALLVALDRSGSMSAPVRGDRTKMDLANIAAASSLELLSPMDEFGLIAVDTKPHVIVPLQELREKAAIRDKVLRVESAGGGIYIFEALAKAASMLSTAKARTRHIILFSDAADSEQPGRYWELLDKITKAGITVSVIGLGTEEDCDANLLKKIANQGNGRIFFTRDPEELPRLFSQDTFVAAKSTFIDEKTLIKSTPAVRNLLDDDLQFKSVVGGYNLCYVKPGADMHIQTADENKAPILVTWQSGLGRVACYMGTLSGEFRGDFIGQKESVDLFAGLCSWLSSDRRQFIDNMPVTQKIVRGRWQATLHLDPERERELFKDNPQVTLIKSYRNKPPEKIKLRMNWETADDLAASYQLSGNEVIVAMIDAGEGRRLKLSPVCLPYSHEYALLRENEGAAKLKEIAVISGGKELIDLSGAWKSMPDTVQFQSVSEPLLYLALFLFILEVAERRTSILTLLVDVVLRKKSGIGSQAKEQNEAGPEEFYEKVKASRLDKPDILKSAKETEVKSSAKASNEEGFTKALKKAKNQAEKRTRN
ncbi:MAG: VWA domain-containing protein [Candidatus Rifleibacteriota bacterium]